MRFCLKHQTQLLHLWLSAFQLSWENKSVVCCLTSMNLTTSEAQKPKNIHTNSYCDGSLLDTNHFCSCDEWRSAKSFLKSTPETKYGLERMSGLGEMTGLLLWVQTSVKTVRWCCAQLHQTQHTSVRWSAVMACYRYAGACGGEAIIQWWHSVQRGSHRFACLIEWQPDTFS